MAKNLGIEKLEPVKNTELVLKNEEENHTSKQTYNCLTLKILTQLKVANLHNEI